MRERGKGVEAYGGGGDFAEFNYSAASEMPCRKHPKSSAVGICAHCLKDRLVKLVCSECGEQRLSSCSCSDVSSSYRNSCSTVEVGSVGRVSFLIENEKEKGDRDLIPKGRRGEERSEQVIFLRRSTSSCVEVKKTNGFWKIKRLFKKRSKGCERNGEFSDDKSEIWVSNIMGVSRSRSLCSFGGGGAAGEGMSDCALSSAKISDVTSSIFVDSDKQFGFLNDSEPRRSGFSEIPARRINGGGVDQLTQFDRTYSVPNRSVFPAKESDFSAMDESAFIDLKLDLSAESKEAYGGDGGDGFENVGRFANTKSSGGSCRITVNDRGLKRGGRGHKVWKWIFKYNNHANKKEEEEE